MQTFKCNLYFSFRKKQYQIFFTSSFQNYTFINPSLPLFTSHNLTRRRYRVRKGSLIVLLRGRKGRDSIYPSVFGVYSWLWAQGSFQRGSGHNMGYQRLNPGLPHARKVPYPPYCCSNAHLVFSLSSFPLE